jgi:hypothetical protein
VILVSRNLFINFDFFSLTFSSSFSVVEVETAGVFKMVYAKIVSIDIVVKLNMTVHVFFSL